MPKCENCYHKKVCFFMNCCELENCRYFKDRSLITELPCKVGDTLYVVVTESEKFGGSYMKEERITEISTAGRIWINDCYYDNDDIGKMIFLSREEAEKALEESKNDKI